MTTIDNSNVDHDNNVEKAGDGTHQDKSDGKEPQSSVAVLMDERLVKKIPITVVALLAAFVVVSKLNNTIPRWYKNGIPTHNNELVL